MSNDAIQDLDAPVKKVALPKKVQKIESSIPLGYIPIKLSMGGKFGVPMVVHCRNFSTADLVDISLFDDSFLIEKVISILNGIIHEEVDVALWPDKAIIELLVTLYANFFSVDLEDIEFPWDESDVDYLKSKGKTDQITALESGLWKPKVTVSLTSVDPLPIKDNVSSFITFSKKDPKGNVIFSAKFYSYPRFGDVLLLNKVLEDKFSEENKLYETLRQRHETREKLVGKNMDVTHLEPLSDREFLSIQLHEAKKLKYVTLASTAIYLVEFDGKNVEDLSIEEKIEIVSSPMFDVSLGNLFNKKINEMEFGLNPVVKVINPITKEPCSRRFTFQVLAILQAIQASDINGYDISYDD